MGDVCGQALRARTQGPCPDSLQVESTGRRVDGHQIRGRENERVYRLQLAVLKAAICYARMHLASAEGNVL